MKFLYLVTDITSLTFFAILGTTTAQGNTPMETLQVTRSNHGALTDDREVSLFTLSNPHGMTIQISEFGATLCSVKVPDRDGKIGEITHGYDTLAEWVADTNYFGATVGRFANRIADGKFTLHDVQYLLPKNNEPGGIKCSLHGGDRGFNKRLWKGEIIKRDDVVGVKLTRISENGEEGYPGKMMTSVSYLLNIENEMRIDITATTNTDTPVNITNHTYWNLSGEQTSTILKHELQIEADSFLPTNAGMIPTGEVRSVNGTPLDFTQPHTIGERIDDDFEALKIGGGYDHAWIIRGDANPTEPRLMARLYEPKSGRVMELSSNQPALQFYSGNFLDGTTKGRNGESYPYRSAIALEPEAYPDAPNQSNFPNCILSPGETYHHQLVYRFSTK